MPDLLDPLRGLRGASVTEPEPVESLRQRSARRRRRQRAVLAVAGACVVLVAGVVTVGAITGDGDPTIETVDQPVTTRSSEPPSTTPSSTPGSTTTAAPGAAPGPGHLTFDPKGLDWLPGSYHRLVNGDTGIFAVGEGSDPTIQVTAEPTRRAFGLPGGGDLGRSGSRILAQYGTQDGATTGDIVAIETTGERVLLPNGPPDDSVVLHDGGFLDRRPVALVSHTTGDGPEATDTRLLVVDVETGGRTDLGSIGGWEDGVAGARLTLDGAIVMTTSSSGYRLERRLLDGTSAWTVPHLGPYDDVLSMSLHAWPPQDVFVLAPGFSSDGRTPELVVRRFDVETGDEGEPFTPTIELEGGLEIGGGFCRTVYAAGLEVLCDQSSGPAFWVDLRQGRTRIDLPGPEHAGISWPWIFT